MTVAAELAELAAAIAVEAGTLVRDGRRRGVAEATTKASPTDLATEWDRASEQLITERLRAARPDDGWIGEEGANHPGTSGIVWIVDPIDGTTNFVYDIPAYAVSIAAVDADGPLAAAVYLPATYELFAASRGGGATRNGQPISASTETDLGRALVATGFSYHADRRGAHGTLVAALLPQIRDIRRSGSAATDLCWVAMGRVDAYFERWLNAWDLAGGQLIATEAGCRTSSFDGGPIEPGSVVVSAPGVHDAFVSAVCVAESALAPGIM